MNIVLFGGAFNPPHIGHLIVIQQALELIDADELWILPDNIGSFGKDLAPSHHRIKMIELLINEIPEEIKSKVKLNTTLIDENLSGETHQYMKALKEKYPQYSFSFLMGSDNLKKFEEWGNWQRLIDNMHFYIYPRNGYKVEKLYNNMMLLESDTQVVTNFSSTIMRKRAQQNLSLKNFIPHTILNYLTQNKLY